jgi:hypothetical protein
MEEVTFYDANGIYYQFAKGEDGITCHINGYQEKPLMGTFTDMENLCYALAPIIQCGVNSDSDVLALANALYEGLKCKEQLEDIFEYLMK